MDSGVLVLNLQSLANTPTRADSSGEGIGLGTAIPTGSLGGAAGCNRRSIADVNGDVAEVSTESDTRMSLKRPLPTGKLANDVLAVVSGAAAPSKPLNRGND